MTRVIAMILLSLLPGILSAKVATDYLRDYQGNNRLTYTETGVVLERNDYYPYGGLFGEEQSLQPYKYSGKELETTNGLNLYDFHARYHDYTLPIFTTQDPQQEKTPWQTPYCFCSNNPINRIDPTGMTDYYNLNGKFVLTVDDGNDVKMMLLIESKKLEEANTAIQEKRYMAIPDESVIKAMEEVYDKTENSENEAVEAGFIVSQNGTVSKVVTGTSGEISNEDWKPAQKDIADANDKISYDVHSHPEQKVKDDTVTPSPTDMENVVGNMPGVLLGFDVKTFETVDFYRKNSYRKVTRYIVIFDKLGILHRTSFESFKKAVQESRNK